MAKKIVNTIKKLAFNGAVGLAKELFQSIKFTDHPHADHIKISDPFVAKDEVHGLKTARVYHYVNGMYAPHKRIQKGGSEIVSDDGILLNNLIGYHMIDDDQPDQAQA